VTVYRIWLAEDSNMLIEADDFTLGSDGELSLWRGERQVGAFSRKAWLVIREQVEHPIETRILSRDPPM